MEQQLAGGFLRRFYDLGAPHASDRIVSAAFLTAYEELSRGKRTVLKPGDKVQHKLFGNG